MLATNLNIIILFLISELRTCAEKSRKLQFRSSKLIYFENIYS